MDRVKPHDETAWTSRGDCETLLAERKATSRPPRIATWNIRYFPDAIEGEQTDPEEATDVSWAACAIASLDVDVLVVQEFKNTDEGLSKQQELVSRLNELTGGDWQLEVDQCAPAEVQHPGFLFDRTRAQGEAFRELPDLNPNAECSNAASPGFAGYFRVEGGPDFHLIAVHGQTGASPESYQKRATTNEALQAAVDEAAAIDPDTDVVFAGDFNSVGCDTCDPAVSNQEEIARLVDSAAALEPAFAVVPKSQACTRVASDMPDIDHILASSSMSEISPEAVVHVAGICEEVECDRQMNWLEDAYDRLSDHCPLVLELAAADDD